MWAGFEFSKCCEKKGKKIRRKKLHKNSQNSPKHPKITHCSQILKLCAKLTIRNKCVFNGPRPVPPAPEKHLAPAPAWDPEVVL
jgi:hypothetical protein